MEGTAEERDVVEVLERFDHALFDKDAPAAIALMTDDVVTYDLAPPLALEAAEARCAAGMNQWFETWNGPIVSKSGPVTVAVGGDIAHVFNLQHMTGTKKDGTAVDLWFRATSLLRRTPDGWRISHMHNSVPFAMDGSERALTDLKPETDGEKQ